MGATAGVIAALLATGAAAHADPPSNDNYLASTPILTESYHTTVDTAEATEQANILDPAGGGRPAGQGPAETLTCNGRSYGKTVWYDFLPPSAGGVRITASGFDTVVAVYEYDPKTSSIVRSLGCQDASTGTTETFDIAPPKIEKGKYYTVQVGGAVVNDTAQSGTLDFGLEFYGDRDGDGVLDPNDLCRDLAGTRAGCPPQLPGTPRLALKGSRILALDWAGLPHGIQVRAECRACGRRGVRQTVRVSKPGAVAHLTAFSDVRARRGAVLKVYATSALTGSGDYRYGAIGKYARYRIGSGSLTWSTRCLVPGPSRKQMTCPR